jgi:preprotein translocase subunit SecG
MNFILSLGGFEMSILAVIMTIVHVILCVGVSYFALKRMQKNAELGGAFGSGSAHTMFGREKGLDSVAKLGMWFGILFMISCFITTMLIIK